MDKRLIAAGIETEVKISPEPDTDWNDIELQRRFGT